MNAQTSLQKIVIFWVVVTMIFASLSSASVTPVLADELQPEIPGEQIHYFVDESGQVSISPVLSTGKIDVPSSISTNAICSNAPTLISPANGATLNTLIPVLQWNTDGELNASGIKVMWSRDADFLTWGSTMTAWFLLDTWEIAQNLEPETTYYWRAQFLCGEDREDGPLSSVWSFTTGSGGTFPSTPALLSPASGSTVNTPVTLEWSPVSGATFYKVAWREIGSSGYSYNFTNDAYYELGEWVDTDIEYEWWVFAGNYYAFSPVSAVWTFNLVEPIFSDVLADYWAWSFIERLYNAGITGGCATTPNLLYCPDETVTRAQMAVFLLKSMHGKSYTPPLVGDSTGFGDVATSHWAAAWIKQLAAEGITGGCGVGLYCPEAPVTRAQMAVFLLKAKNGSGYTPPVLGDGSGFGDVPNEYWAARWIKQLAAESITGGCGAGNYCPENPVTRAQMAVFIVKTFGLP